MQPSLVRALVPGGGRAGESQADSHCVRASGSTAETEWEEGWSWAPPLQALTYNSFASIHLVRLKKSIMIQESEDPELSQNLKLHLILLAC